MHHLRKTTGFVIVAVSVAVWQELLLPAFAARLVNDDDLKVNVTPTDYMSPGHQADKYAGDIYGPIHDPYGRYAHQWGLWRSWYDYDEYADLVGGPAPVVHEVVHHLDGASMLQKTEAEDATVQMPPFGFGAGHFTNDDAAGGNAAGGDDYPPPDSTGHVHGTGHDESHEDHFVMHDDFDYGHDYGDPGYYSHDYGHHDENEDHLTHHQDRDTDTDYAHGYGYYGHDYGHHEDTEDHFDHHEDHSEDGHFGAGDYRANLPVGNGQGASATSLLTQSSDSDGNDTGYNGTAHSDPHHLGIMFEDGTVASSGATGNSTNQKKTKKKSKKKDKNEKGREKKKKDEKSNNGKKAEAKKAKKSSDGEAASKEEKKESAKSKGEE